ncbi:hypothetical protein BYT27DRAFT_6640770 [Phlegmacium glaucopus]|nr:hypothetical protein BYT27DRAFT_6640770 [Phlegmacium glaucopus]
MVYSMETDPLWCHDTHIQVWFKFLLQKPGVGGFPMLDELEHGLKLRMPSFRMVHWQRMTSLRNRYRRNTLRIDLQSGIILADIHGYVSIKWFSYLAITQGLIEAGYHRYQTVNRCSTDKFNTFSASYVFLDLELRRLDPNVES